MSDPTPPPTPSPGPSPPAADDDDSNDPLVRAVRQRRDRRDRGRRDGDMSVGRRLAQIGVLGWIIVGPTLGGMFLGHWLDQRWQTGLFWTAPLLMLGLALGCWVGWKWMNAK